MASTSSDFRSKALGRMVQGAGGFTLGLLGALGFLLLTRLINLERFLLGWIPEEQKFWHLLGLVALGLIVLGLSGVLMGVIGGWSLWRIDSQALRRRYMLAGGAAYAIAQLALVLFVLLLVLAAVVNNEPALHLSRFLFLFGIFGLVYGLISGFWLGLISLGWRYFWRVWLAGTAGYTLGGLLLGLLAWLAAQAADRELRLIGGMVLLLGIVALFALGGAAFGWVYGWVADRRLVKGGIPLKMSPGWAIVGIVLLAACGLLAFRVGGTLVEFVTIQEGTLSEVIGLSTTGSSWSEPTPVGRLDPGEAGEVQLAGGIEGNAGMVWSQDGEIYFSQGSVAPGEAQAAWGLALNVSESPDGGSSQPQTHILNDERWSVVWAESGEAPGIWYRECDAQVCSPAVEVANASSGLCAGGALEQPTIAIDPAGNRMVVWRESQGGLAYRTWGETGLDSAQSGCLAQGEAQGSISLAADNGGFELAFSDGVQVFTSRFTSGAWLAEPELVGEGKDPFLYFDRQQGRHLAWCDPASAMVYQMPDGTQHRVIFPACRLRPEMAEDGLGQIHLAWYSDQVENNSGVAGEGSFFYESILQEGSLTTPAIAAQISGLSQHSLANDRGGTLYLAWVNQQAVQQATQLTYECTEPPPNASGQAILESIIAGGLVPPGQTPYCGNRFERLLFLPEPPAGIPQPATPYGAFDTVDALAASARYEVLFTVMEYQGDQNLDSPGFRLAATTVDLYNKLKANPKEYPRGLTVRILLGNYPNLATFQWGDQIYYVLDDLKAAGLPALSDAELGWKVEIANFDGQFPHGHTKFMVVDGKTAVANGYNYSYLHLDKEHPSGLGVSLIDLGLQISGPVAQATLANYDDLWNGSDQIVCESLDPEGGDWDTVCDWQKASVTHVPEVLKFYLTGADETAFSLLRTAAHPLADEAVPAAIRSATETLDFFQVNFSMDIVCWLNLINPSFCTFEDNALPYMQALVDAVEQNQVKTRVIFTDINSNGIENFIAADMLLAELERRGLSDLVEIRYWPDRMHAKAILVDGETLIIGSQNMHYSSFGENGLTELGQSTDNPDAVQYFKEAFEYWWGNSLPVE
jgi:phosphatidylserine/phosphatidylglycerophosphate/cardiolipin synthase-like enzyme